MDDITNIFISFLQNCGSVDIAEAEFKRTLHEDPDMKTAYREWCDMVGSSEKNGFFDFCDDYLDSRNDVWNSLDNDFDA